jgi:hypothetical protein
VPQSAALCPALAVWGPPFSGESCGTNRAGHHLRHPHQVVSRRERQYPASFLNPAMSHLADQRDRLQPPETLFDPLPLPLADRVALMPRRATVNPAAAVPFRVPRQVRGEVFGRTIAVVTAGGDLGRPQPATGIENLLGAGAVISAFSGSRSPRVDRAAGRKW